MENSVVLLNSSLGDESVCASAWVSTGVPENSSLSLYELFQKMKEDKRNTPESLIKFLLEHEHEVPFEHNIITWQVTVDWATHIHILKHRLFTVSVSTESARYKELPDKWYIPDDWDMFSTRCLQSYSSIGNWLYHFFLQYQTKRLGRKRAKESSRYFLTATTQLSSIVSMNMRSFLHFYKLRSSPNAQAEIREVANKMLHCLLDDGKWENTLKYIKQGE